MLVRFRTNETTTTGLREKKAVVTTQSDMRRVISQDETTYAERKEPEWLVKSQCMLPLCHPFTAVVAGPTGCGKLHGS